MPKGRKEIGVVASAFIKRNNKYLLVFDPRFGFWRVPGGRVKFGEKVEDALKREMREEFNIDVKILKFLGFGQDVVTLLKDRLKRSRILLYFECETKKGSIEPKSKTEISQIKWLNINEIKNIKNLEPGMRVFISAL